MEVNGLLSQALAERPAELRAPAGQGAARPAARRGREAHPATLLLRHLHVAQPRWLCRRGRLRSQDARPRCSPDIDPGLLKRGDEVVLNESLSVVLAREGERSGEVVKLKEILEGGNRAIVYGRADEERALRGGGLAPGHHPSCRRRAALRPARRAARRAARHPGGRGPRPGGGARRHVRGRRGAGLADRGDHRRSRAAVPAPRAVRHLPAARTQGDPALRPPRLRQDPHRQGRGELAGAEGGRIDRQRQHPQLLPQHQGPRAAQQVRGRDRASDPTRVPARWEKAEEGVPVIIFFDEMDSLFRTRGSGISSDMESTVVPSCWPRSTGSRPSAT